MIASAFIQEKNGVEVLDNLEYVFEPLPKRSGIGVSDNKVSSKYLGMLASAWLRRWARHTE
ncbi:hypothetical protein I7I53_08082 [Histoplasma capsulatum var. duboisii H88]|uniref:Uncharacterized protein n=1 Tax=Ajellomyces capsulatus (strain H88) TaxID=544711 RepID=A0A8A1LFY6_AJEC8|nr:hypothetical protein I7I53_08082 [Histoplasma capsulatum var. duboisii H88]